MKKWLLILLFPLFVQGQVFTSYVSTYSSVLPPQEYGLYYNNTSVVSRGYTGLDNVRIYLSTNISGQYVNNRDNILYGGNVEFYTNQGNIHWASNRTGWYVIFNVSGVSYGPYIYDILEGSVISSVPSGMLYVDRSSIEYAPPTTIGMFGSVGFSVTPYSGTLDPNVLNFAAGDKLRIYKYDVHQDLLHP